MTGDVIVDENNDKVEIKKDDKPYLALGADLSDDQKNIVLSYGNRSCQSGKL